MFIASAWLAWDTLCNAASSMSGFDLLNDNSIVRFVADSVGPQAGVAVEGLVKFDRAPIDEVVEGDNDKEL